MKTIIRILDSRAAVGEQSFEEEMAQAERQHQGDLQGEDSDRDSEAEERAFKAKVAAVVRKMPEQKRFAIVPHPSAQPSCQPLAGTSRCWTGMFTSLPRMWADVTRS